MRRGFSLVELSIVLVILGLLTGGILAGQSLIRASELRAVTTEFSRYVSATNSFRDKYFALPGDMNNATKFWGQANVGSCALTTTNDARTCNGNGNGVIDASYSGDAGNEHFRFWQQLANAGLIEGNYTGIRYYMATDGAESQQYDNQQRGDNAPASKMSQGTWGAFNYAYYNSNGSAFNVPYTGNIMVFGGSLGYVPPAPTILKPEEAWNLDTKMDDGKPGIGKINSYYSTGATGCVTGAASNADTANAVYNLSVSGLNCGLLFVNPF